MQVLQAERKRVFCRIRFFQQHRQYGNSFSVILLKNVLNLLLWWLDCILNIFEFDLSNIKCIVINELHCGKWMPVFYGQMTDSNLFFYSTEMQCLMKTLVFFYLLSVVPTQELNVPKYFLPFVIRYCKKK